MDPKQIADKLEECKRQIPEFQRQRHGSRKSPEFTNWHARVEKWLRAGGPPVARELERFEKLDYSIKRRAFSSGENYSGEMQRDYEVDLGIADGLLESAIDSLRIGLTFPAGPAAQAGQPNPVAVYVTNLQHMEVALQQVTLLQVLERVAEKAASETKDPAEKKRILERLKELTKNETFATLAGASVGELLKGLFSAAASGG